MCQNIFPNLCAKGLLEKINAKINKRSLNKNKALKRMQIGLLQANKNEKYVNSKDIDKLISTLKK